MAKLQNMSTLSRVDALLDAGNLGVGHLKNHVTGFTTDLLIQIYPDLPPGFFTNLLQIYPD